MKYGNRIDSVLSFPIVASIFVPQHCSTYFEQVKSQQHNTNRINRWKPRFSNQPIRLFNFKSQSAADKEKQLVGNSVIFFEIVQHFDTTMACINSYRAISVILIVLCLLTVSVTSFALKANGIYRSSHTQLSSSSRQTVSSTQLGALREGATEKIAELRLQYSADGEWSRFHPYATFKL